METKKTSATAGMVSSYTRNTDTNLVSNNSSTTSSNNNKRKSNESNSSNCSSSNSNYSKSDQDDFPDQLQPAKKCMSSRPSSSVDTTEDQNKKLKTTHDNSTVVTGLNKPTTNKIQLKLSSSLSSGLRAAAAASSATVLKSNSSTKNDANQQTESISIPKLPTAKLPTGNLAPASNNKQPVLLKNVSEKVAKVFGSDDDDDNETEMPMEAKMKMRNLGRNTPTSQGPNSYGKTNLGFCDSRKLFEKQLKEKADQLLREETEGAANK